jgi:hypothetical protein
MLGNKGDCKFFFIFAWVHFKVLKWVYAKMKMCLTCGLELVCAGSYVVSYESGYSSFSCEFDKNETKKEHTIEYVPFKLLPFGWIVISTTTRRIACCAWLSATTFCHDFMN